MKKIKLLLIFIFAITWISNVSANTDQTNAFNFTYDCIDWQWVLKTDFSLWWHHHYLRQYHINKPWIIEIADSNHTTVAKSTNISIDWCDYHPRICNITQEWDWQYIEWADNEVVSLNIDTSLEVTKSWSKIYIDGSWNTDETNISFSDSSYTWTWKNIELDLNDNWIELLEYWYDSGWTLTGQVIKSINFINRILDWKKEYYYKLSQDNKNISIFKRKFKKVSTWVAKSSNNSYDIYPAISWTNFGNSVSSSNSWYNTTMNYWDYTQHHYTTTKVKLHRVDISCSEVEYSDWTKDPITSELYDWTLSWIRHPEFWWPIEINQVREWTWWSTIYASDKLLIKWLNYKVVWKVWWKIMWVKKIMVTLKANDITLWESNINLSSIKKTTWTFWNINAIIKDDSWNIITKKSWDYQIVFTFFGEAWEQWGTYETPLTIIPDNNIKKSWDVSIDKYNTYASNNSSDEIKVCQKFTDEFGNEINKDYWNVNTVSILDWVINNWNQVLKVSNTTFKNSEFCFKLNSFAPISKVLKFKIKVPKHKENINLNFNWNYKTFSDVETPQITFKKPIIINKLEVVNWGNNPVIWKNQKYRLTLFNLWNIIFNWNIDINKNYIKPSVSWHKWLSFRDISNNISNSNLITYFSWELDATDNILKAPWIDIINLPISYRISWKEIKYNLDNYSLVWKVSCDKETLWVKIYGQLQWDWKSQLTWQKANISDLSKWNLRWEIRKEAYKTIRNRPSDKTKNVNWIIYVKWDVKYSEVKNNLNNNDTIIVKDWNFIIDEDINKNIWIIVLKDNYNVLNDYDNKWNIYVNSNVWYIKAIIYADWTFRSANKNWLSYNDSDLEKRLFLDWSLFTRNTIGWAVKWSTNYTLPWWKITSDFDLAEIYDLNYVRKVPMLCDGSENDWYSFIIKYNSSNQTNPPKLFGN